MIKALGCKQYWLTETGGLYKFGSFWSKKTKKGCTTSASCQLQGDAGTCSRSRRRNKKIKRALRLHVVRRA